MLCQKVAIFSFSFKYSSFISLHFLHWSGTSEITMLNNRGTSRHSCFITNFIGTLFSVLSIKVHLVFTKNVH